ncbi:MAG: hypothetical protein HC830_14760 [Bacteroidetes bacterium]|nr:hypothetical protein [Bacteroidota bacterium]
MEQAIKKYPVQHPILKKYIRFFWELRVEHMQLNHTFIPQRNINLRFNLSGTPQYESLDGEERLLENVFFSGLHDQFRHSSLRLNGKVDVLGICFFT